MTVTVIVTVRVTVIVTVRVTVIVTVRLTVIVIVTDCDCDFDCEYDFLCHLCQCDECALPELVVS